MGKLTGKESVQEAMVKMSESAGGYNPGAMEFVSLYVKNGGGDALDGLKVLDHFEIYGERLYMLWNDCCGRNLQEAQRYVLSMQLGDVTKEFMKEHLSGYRAMPIPELDTIESLMARVREFG